MPELISPLRYPGGKSDFLPIFQRLCVQKKIKTFVETHCGGAGLSLGLIANKIIKKAVINDFDPLVASFWREVLGKDISKFIKKIENTTLDMYNYKIQKDIYENFKNGENYSQIDLAFCFLFRNRTNRGGLISAGPIGGYEQKNPKYSMDVRFNKKDIINRILRINMYGKKRLISFKNYDSMKILLDYKPMSNCLFYIDPPYFLEGKNLYDSYYIDENHLALRNVLKELKNISYFVLSYDHSPEILKLYKDFKFVKISKYSYAANAKKQIEILFHSNKITIPLLKSNNPEIIY